jgi:hypothetical protein
MGFNNRQRVLIFGASGSIGEAVSAWFVKRDWEVTAITRSEVLAEGGALVNWISWNPFAEADSVPDAMRYSFNAIVWAQGQNFNDNIHTFNVSAHEDMYHANVVFVMKTLQMLLAQNLLAAPSRLCIISSIWQNIARQNKLSYTVTKSALQGLVQSLAIDLGVDGHLVNAVLPGALDTPMTRNNLNATQIECLERLTPLGRLPTLDDVSSMIGFLCSPENSGITGQFIAADKGFSYAKIL